MCVCFYLLLLLFLRGIVGNFGACDAAVDGVASDHPFLIFSVLQTFNSNCLSSLNGTKTTIFFSVIFYGRPFRDLRHHLNLKSVLCQLKSELILLRLSLSSVFSLSFFLLLTDESLGWPSWACAVQETATAKKEVSLHAAASAARVDVCVRLFVFTCMPAAYSNATTTMLLLHLDLN